MASAIRGVTFQASQASAQPMPDGLACLTTGAVYEDVRWSTARYIPRNIVQGSRQILTRGDILVSTANSKALVGKSTLLRNVPFEATFGAFVTVLRAGPKVDAEYLSLWLRTPGYLGKARELASQTTNIANLSVRDLLDMQLPLVDLRDQRRVAAQLSKQLSAASRAGDLSQERMTAVGMLGRRALDDMIAKAISSGHPSRPLRDALRPRNEIVHPHDRPAGDAVFVGLEHIQSDSGIRLGSQMIHLEDLTGRKARFQRGDIVYGYLRPYLNKVWLADLSGFCSVDQYVFKVDPAVADAEYVAHFMRSSQYLANAPIKTTPGQLPRIRTEEVLEVSFPLPGLAEQRHIAAELQLQLAAIDAMNTSLRVEQKATEALPAALLRRAFDNLAA